MIPIAVSLAGSLGAVSRFVLDGHIRLKYDHSFPWATMIINVSGSLLLGIVSGVLLQHKGFADIGAIVGLGFCGGYTTFSTASFETVRLLERRKYLAATSQAVGGLLLSIIAAAIGIIIGQLY